MPRRATRHHCVPHWRAFKSAAFTLIVPALLVQFTGWSAQWQPLRQVITECRVSAGCNAAQTWLDWAAFLAAPPDNPAGAEVARNTIHTLHAVAFLWFTGVIVGGGGAAGAWHARVHAVLAWGTLVMILMFQPALHTASRATARPEPAFADSDPVLLQLFPAAHGDVPDLVFALDPPTLIGAFLANAILRVHAHSASAWLLGTAHCAATLLYAISLRAVSTPSLTLTALAAWALSRMLDTGTATRTRKSPGDHSDADVDGDADGDESDESDGDGDGDGDGAATMHASLLAPHVDATTAAVAPAAPRFVIDDTQSTTSSNDVYTRTNDNDEKDDTVVELEAHHAPASGADPVSAETAQ